MENTRQLEEKAGEEPAQAGEIGRCAGQPSESFLRGFEMILEKICVKNLISPVYCLSMYLLWYIVSGALGAG